LNVRISNILIAQQGTNSLASTLSGSSGGCLWLGTNGTAITNTTNLTPTAMAHIKGSGSTSATNTLLVQNSAGNNSILTTDDGKSLLTANLSNDAPLVVNNAYGWTGSFSATIQQWKSAGVTKASINGNGVLSVTSVSAQTFDALQPGSLSDLPYKSNSRGAGNGLYFPAVNVTGIATSSIERMRVDASGNMGIGTSTTTNAKLEVSVASGTTNGIRLKAFSDAGTSYLLSAGTESFQDNFKIKMVNGNVTMGTQLNGYTFGLETFNGTALQIFNSGNISIGNTTESAKLFVKGSGTTSATSSLLVQNSSGTQLLKTFDDGEIQAGSSGATQFKIYNTNGLAIARDGSFNSNIRIREFGTGGPTFQMNGNSTPTFKMLDGSNFSCISSHANWTGVGKGTVENTSAALQTDSTSRGWLPPRMTTAEKLAIGTPANGLLVFDTSLNQMSYYNGVTWINW
jgi:hypothetical protein